MKWFGIFVLLLVVFVGGWSIYTLNRMAGLIPGHVSPSSRKSDTVGFVKTVNQKLYDAQRARQNIEKYSPTPSAEVEHVFLGRTATDVGNSCLVDMDRALKQTYRNLKIARQLPHVPHEKFQTCEDFEKVRPPTVPNSFAAWGEIAEKVRHFCYPIRISGAFTPNGRPTPPTGDLTIATVFQGQTADDIIAQLKKDSADDDTILKFGRYSEDPFEVSSKAMIAQTVFQPVKTLRCEGFDLFQLTVTAKQWPLTDAPD